MTKSVIVFDLDDTLANTYHRSIDFDFDTKDENLWEMQLYGWYVKMDDVYDLNELYQENPHMTRKEAAQFLIERAGNYRSDIYKQSEMLTLEICGYVIDEEGYAQTIECG